MNDVAASVSELGGVDGEGVAGLHRAGLHPSGEPAHALLGGAVGPGVGVDVPLGPLLDVVVTHGLGRSQRTADLLTAGAVEEGLTGLRVGGGGGVVDPDSRVAVRLELQTHRVRRRAAARAVGLGHLATQVLDVVAELVGHDVLLRQRSVSGAQGTLHLGEEAHVQVDRLVPRAVEGAHGRGCVATGRGDLGAVPQDELGLCVGDPSLGGQLVRPYCVEGLGGGYHAALGVLVGALPAGAHGGIDRRGRWPRGPILLLRPQHGGQVHAGELGDEDDGDDSQDRAAADHGAPAAAGTGLDPVGIDLDIAVEGHGSPLRTRLRPGWDCPPRYRETTRRAKQGRPETVAIVGRAVSATLVSAVPG